MAFTLWMPDIFHFALKRKDKSKYKPLSTQHTIMTGKKLLSMMAVVTIFVHGVFDGGGDGGDGDTDHHGADAEDAQLSFHRRSDLRIGAVKSPDLVTSPGIR
eukprot:TRINITY_DN36791_c0_g1_i2.p1 TRINITY_DN36791_c0_g1~~TRINITY_DN36791_c0_g1_i2.p1  ORF type:complete len:102 (+),score=1.06 TRINITY_DN36791_c0_g1_i2:78-383(+)